MSVAGGNNWLIKLFPKPDDLFIDLPDIVVTVAALKMRLAPAWPV